MKKIALIGVTMLTAISLAACSPSSNSGSKNSEKSTTESSNKPTLEIPVSVVADGSKTAAITGKTTPNTKVQIGYGIIGDKVTSDKEGNFTLKYEIDEANDQDTIEVTAKNDGGKTTKEITIKQNPEVIKKKEADAKAKADAEAKAKADAEAKAKAEADAKAKEAAIPIEYKNALKKAQSYSNMMHMSKAGIYDQLTSDMGEGFSAEAAQYAVDNLNADYNKNALEKAKSYQSQMAMSKDSIYDQLTSSYGEKFTAEEAQYAVNNLPA